MAFLDETVQEQVRKALSNLTNPVKILVFTQANDGKDAIICQTCADNLALVEEVAALSDKISVEVYDFVADEEVVKLYGIDKIPAMTIVGGEDAKDYGIRLYGIPSGYEFSTLIADIILVSTAKNELSQKTLNQIGKLKKPVHIQVYTTPT